MGSTLNKQQTDTFVVGKPELPYFRANILAHLIQHVYSCMHILDILVGTDADRVQEQRAFCSPDTYISSTLQESLIWPEGWKCDCVKYKLNCIFMMVINTALFGGVGYCTLQHHYVQCCTATGINFVYRLRRVMQPLNLNIPSDFDVLSFDCLCCWSLGFPISSM